jgi:hypothetical protein
MKYSLSGCSKVQYSPKDYEDCKCGENYGYSIEVPYCYNIFLESALHVFHYSESFIPAISKGNQDRTAQVLCTILNEYLINSHF